MRFQRLQTRTRQVLARRAGMGKTLASVFTASPTPSYLVVETVQGCYAPPYGLRRMTSEEPRTTSHPRSNALEIRTPRMERKFFSGAFDALDEQ